MLKTSRSLWVLSAPLGSMLLAVACSSDTVGSAGQTLDPTTSTTGAQTTGAQTTGAVQDATTSGFGGASATSGGSTGAPATTDGTLMDAATTVSSTTSSISSVTTGNQAVSTSAGATTTMGAGGTTNVTPSLTSASAGGASSTTDASTTTDSTTSTAAGGTSMVVDDPECEDFCDLFFEECADEVENSFFSDQLYPDHDSCMAVCVTFQKGGTYGSDTLGCRRAHLVDNPDGGIHCTHASESGGGQCPPMQ